MTAAWPLVMVAVAGALVLMVRARRLEERHAVLWITVAATSGVALVDPVRDRLADVLGVDAGEAALAVGLAAALVLLLAAYAVIARLAGQSRVLAQRLALLEERLGTRGPGVERSADDRAEVR